jgi:hypothetical protein
LDEVGAAAGVDVEAGEVDLAGAADEGDDEDGADCAGEHGCQRPLPAPAQSGEHGEAGEQGQVARLREGLRQAQPEDQDRAHQDPEPAALADPEQRRRDHDQHQGQVAAVDVRVPEDRVDPEVGVEFVRPDHLVVPDQAAGQVLDAADRHEGERLGRDHAEDQRQQRPVPLDLAQQPIGDGEGDEEEADVLQALREIARVEGLERVEDDGGGQQPGQRSRRPGAGRGGPVAQQDEDDSRRDHEIERHQEVGGVAAGVQGDPERQCRDDRQRQQQRPAAEDVGEQADRDRGPGEQGGGAGVVVAQVDDLLGVPLVAEDQDREEADRDQHRQRALAAGRQQDRGGAGSGGGENAGRGQEVAQGACLGSGRGFALQADLARGGTRCRRIVPGGTSVRCCPSSLTRSL